MKKCFSLLLLSIFMLQGYAWDARGHRIVADIAYANLTKKARTRVDAVLGEKGMIWTASWPDEIKSDTIYPESHVWHYQNLNSGLSYAYLDSLLDYPTLEGKHLFYAKDSLTRVLRENPNDEVALKFIVHLAGDEFQPMHMAHADDLGGNRVRLTWFGQKTNLHSLWDRYMIEGTQYSYTEMSEMLQLKYADQKKAIYNMTERECVHRTYTCVCDLYAYQEALGEAPRGYEYTYVYRFRDMMEYQLYAAGIQLAKLLNEIYG